MSDASHHEQLLNQVTDRVCFLGLERKITWANQAFLQDANVDTIDEVWGLTLNEINIDANLLNQLIETENAVFESRELQTRQQVRFSWEDDEVTLKVQGYPLVSDADTFDAVAMQYGMENACEYLNYEKLYFECLMKNSQDFIYFKDRSSKFRRVSESMIERLGAQTMDEVLGKSDFDFWDQECAQGFFEDEQKIIETGQAMTGILDEEVRTDAENSWVISSKMPLYDEDNNIIGTFGISKDMTELKQTELKLEDTHRQLMKASRQAGMAEIATNVIHNVGNVLNSINISIATGSDLIKNQNVTNLKKAAQMLEDNVGDQDFLLTNPKGKVLPSFIKHSADVIEANQVTLLHEFNSLRKNLDHVKTVINMQQEYAGAKHVLETISISSLVEDAIQIGEGTLQRSGITISKDYKQDIKANVEKHKILQVLINLIRNAKHACEDTTDDRNKQIAISIDIPTEGFFSIEIADNGVGIAAKNLTSIFNHGFTTKESGKGFGLHASANAAKEMGGSLIATSTGLGQGAAFVLTLPVEPKQLLHSKTETIGMDALAELNLAIAMQASPTQTS